MHDARAGETAGHPSWQETLGQLLPFFGHRNWIVIADSAYPAHASGGIEVVLAADEHVDVVRSVLDMIREAGHVGAAVYTDAELDYVAETDAPGISALRDELDGVLAGLPRTPLLHEQIIAKLDEAASRFRVLVLKTRMSKPYTSVFLELGCGYWSVDAERSMRMAMGKLAPSADGE